MVLYERINRETIPYGHKGSTIEENEIFHRFYDVLEVYDQIGLCYSPEPGYYDDTEDYFNYLKKIAESYPEKIVEMDNFSVKKKGREYDPNKKYRNIIIDRVNEPPYANKKGLFVEFNIEKDPDNDITTFQIFNVFLEGLGPESTVNDIMDELIKTSKPISMDDIYGLYEYHEERDRFTFITLIGPIKELSISEIQLEDLANSISNITLFK